MEQEIALFFWSLKDTILFSISEILSGKLYIILSSGFFVIYAISKLKKKSIQFLITMIIAVSASDLICYRILKPLINRSRPRVELSLTNRPASAVKKKYSMPSNHASNMFSFFTVYIFYLKRYRGILLFNSSIISISRITMVKHYPTDILLGIATGFAIGISSIYFLSFIDSLKIFKRFKHAWNFLVNYILILVLLLDIFNNKSTYNYKNN